MRQTQSLRDTITKLEAELASVNRSLEASQAEVVDLLANSANREKALVKVHPSQPQPGCSLLIESIISKASSSLRYSAISRSCSQWPGGR